MAAAHCSRSNGPAARWRCSAGVPASSTSPGRSRLRTTAGAAPRWSAAAPRAGTPAPRGSRARWPPTDRTRCSCPRRPAPSAAGSSGSGPPHGRWYAGRPPCRRGSRSAPATGRAPQGAQRCGAGVRRASRPARHRACCRSPPPSTSHRPASGAPRRSRRPSTDVPIRTVSSCTSAASAGAARAAVDSSATARTSRPGRRMRASSQALSDARGSIASRDDDAGAPQHGPGPAGGDRRPGPGRAAPGRARHAPPHRHRGPDRPAADRQRQRADPRALPAAVLAARPLRPRAARPGQRPGAAPAGRVLGARGEPRPARDPAAVAVADAPQREGLGRHPVHRRPEPGAGAGRARRARRSARCR